MAVVEVVVSFTTSRQACAEAAELRANAREGYRTPSCTEVREVEEEEEEEKEEEEEWGSGAEQAYGSRGEGRSSFAEEETAARAEQDRGAEEESSSSSGSTRLRARPCE